MLLMAWIAQWHLSMSKIHYSKPHVDAMRSKLLFIIYFLSAKIKRTIDYTNAHIEAVEQDANKQLQDRIAEVALLVEALEGNSELMWNELKACEAEVERLQAENRQLKLDFEKAREARRKPKKYRKTKLSDFEG